MYRHTMHIGYGLKVFAFTETPDHPFGEAGVHYSVMNLIETEFDHLESEIKAGLTNRLGVVCTQANDQTKGR